MSKVHISLLLVAMGASAMNASAKEAQVNNISVAPAGNNVRIEAELSFPMKPIISMADNPPRLIIEFQNASFAQSSEYLTLNRNGVVDVQAGPSPANSATTRIVVDLDEAHPYAIESLGTRFVLNILPNSTGPRVSAAPKTAAPSPIPVRRESHVTATQVKPVSKEAAAGSPVAARRTFKVKYIAGNTVYIDGGVNSGLQVGMSLEIPTAQPVSSPTDGRDGQNTSVASLRIIGVAASSAITEVVTSDRVVRVGDAAQLSSNDVAAAARNAQNVEQSTMKRPHPPTPDSSSSSSTGETTVSNSFRSSRKQPEESSTRLAGRIGLDFSSITSTGSTPGTSMQRGISFQSDMTNILGTHWNLQGYWRGRITGHSQFREPTIEESLNKTYTMQLYYDNPGSRWVAGIGRLYLPWATGLDTIDGAYVGHKWPLGMTTGIFGGSTPDINSWHYRPNQRIGGAFVNFQGGDYEGIHFSSTTGAGVNSIVWKIDRPFAFFENEASYKGKVSVYHSLIADSLRGVSTKGMRLGPGISHSYFTMHYMPNQLLSFDVYHNYFRDVPTATTTILGTGVLDKLLFQGLSGGVHVKPVRNVALYTTLGVSKKSGDSHRSLNQMYGGSWSEIGRSGFRADFHYSKFDSNFGEGNYKVFSLSRQVTNRAFWNVQMGQQNLTSLYTVNHGSIYLDDSFDINIGRKSYLQSGYTYVNGATLNYRQWYFSWGYRFDGGKKSPEFVETQNPVH